MKSQKIGMKSVFSFLVQPITEQNDIWALGTCIFAALAYGKGPYEIDLIHNVISRCFQGDIRPKSSQLHQYFKGKLVETQAI